MQTDVSVSSKHQTLQGVAFPLHRDAVEALKRYKDKMINYVQLVSPYRVAKNPLNVRMWGTTLRDRRLLPGKVRRCPRIGATRRAI